MALVSAFNSQAQTQAQIDEVMTQVASQMNDELRGQVGIDNVVYDKLTHGLYINPGKSLINLCEEANIPRTDIKKYMLEGMAEGGTTAAMKDMVTMLNEMNVKFGARYTYQGKRYTDLFRTTDF